MNHKSLFKHLCHTGSVAPSPETGEFVAAQNTSVFSPVQSYTMATTVPGRDTNERYVPSGSVRLAFWRERINDVHLCNAGHKYA